MAVKKKRKLPSYVRLSPDRHPQSRKESERLEKDYNISTDTVLTVIERIDRGQTWEIYLVESPKGDRFEVTRNLIVIPHNAYKEDVKPRKKTRRVQVRKARAKKNRYIPVVGDEDELEEWAEQWGVSVDQAEDMLEYLEESTDLFDPPLNDYGRPDDDYMLELAETLDIDVSDLYDMYYGYPPGSHGRV